MLFIALLLNFVSFAAPVHSTTVPETRASGSLTGTVLGADGKPLAGATVLVADRRTKHSWPLESEFAQSSSEHPVHEDVTDLDGRFRITRLRGGLGRLVIRSSGHATLRLERIVIAARSTLDMGDVQLSLSETLHGAILDSDELPVSGAKVYSLPRRDESRGIGTQMAALELETDGLGRFELNSLPLGEWTLLIAASDHAVQRFEGSLLLDEGSSTPVTMRLQKPAKLRGRVHSLPTVREFSHLVVRAIPAAQLDPTGAHAKFAQGFTETNVEGGGGFLFEDLLPDTTYILRAQLRAQTFGDLDAWSPTAMMQSGASKGRLEWLPSARLSFRALDVADSKLAENFTLKLEGASPFEPKLSSGRVERHVVKDVRPTRADSKITVVGGGHGYRKFESQPISLEPGILTRVQDITLVEHPVLEVQVTDALTRRPIFRAHVIVREDQSNPIPRKSYVSLTEPNGRARVNDSPGVRRRVGITAHGYAPQAIASPFELVDGVLLVELEAGFDLTAKVSDSDGEPLAGEGVTVSFSEDADRFLFNGTDVESHTAFTDQDGVAWFQHLGTNEYEFILASWNVHTDLILPQNIRLEKGPVREISFGTDTRTRLTGYVLQAGLPVAGAAVRCDDLSVRTDLSGAYVLDPIDPETQTAVVNHPLRAASHTEQFRLNVTKNERTIHLPETLIQGIVIDAKGQPVVGAEIYISDDRWQQSGSMAGMRGSNLFRIARDERDQPHALSDARGWFTVNGINEAHGTTLSARTSDGFVGLQRVRGIRAGAHITGVELVVRPPAVLNIQALNEKLSSAERLALVASFDGEAQGGAWMRVLAPYTGQSWKLSDLPPGKWKLTLVALSEYGAVRSFDRLERVRVNSNETLDLLLD